MVKKVDFIAFLKKLETVFDKNTGHDYRYGKYLFKRLETTFDKHIGEDYSYEEYLKRKNKY